MTRKMIKAGLTAMTAVILLLAMSPIANAAQGGWDRDHYWMKIGAGELRKNHGVSFNPCMRALEATRSPSQAAGACWRMSGFVDMQARRQPNAHGYWAELRGDVVNHGTW